MTKRKEHKTEPQALSRATAVIGGRAFVTVLLTSVVAIAVNARQPKLVVGIMVDGLKQEYIDLLRTQFVKGGFNRFLTEGVVLENVDYGTNLDPAAATAVVMTGASPAVNGIPGAMRYDPLAKRLYSTVHDPAAVGNYTDETYSPRGLRVSTLSDESRIAGAGVTYVYSIAPGPEQAVIMGGHSGNGVAWLNTRTGNWATSTFYHDFPQVLNQRNRTTPLSTRIQTMEWTPSLVGAGAEFLPEHLTHYPFRYTFAAGDMERFAAFRSSPLVNTEITQIATELINTLKLGTHDGADMLNIAYTLQPYPFSKSAENRYELVDSYIKLDNDLAGLLNTINTRVGADNAIIYLAATPPSARRRRDDSKWNIPVGEFSTRKAASLLNLYLIALHGNGEWVKAVSDNQFYLNPDAAKAHNVDMPDLRREVANYLRRMSGVNHALSIDDIMTGHSGTDNAEALRRNTVADYAGDVTIDLLPGWELVDDYMSRGKVKNSGTVFVNTLTTAPAYILAPGVKPEIIRSVVDARILAPTIAGRMHIRSPNGAALPPLRLKDKE
ncbi:MAG: alkaline phosphatase family protein [Bacteroidales bacterium]|nr:alkaline phosphatase family protein [Bacteroidales bacterium]